VIQFSEKRVPKVVIGLTLFWLGVVEAFFWTGPFNFRFLPMWLASILAGVFMAKSSSEEFRDQILARLCYDKKKRLPLDDRRAFLHKSRGVSSSLGKVPFKRNALPCAPDLDMATLIDNLPKELSEEQFKVLFAQAFPADRTSEPFKQLTSRAARTLCHSAHIAHPAGIDRHGGRSLLTHTMLVTALLLHRAPSYKYAPTRHTPTDPEFKLDPLDPLLPVIGFLHDIGKLTKLAVNSSTGAITILPDHTGESVRIAADFGEYWSPGISHEDRLMLQDMISYSHSLNSLPVKKSTRAKPQVTSDRLYALVDLLHSCDVMASIVEMGTSYDFAASPDQIELPKVEEDIESMDLYDEFLNFISIRADINAMNGIKSVGFRYKGDIDGKPMNVVIFDEKKFAEDFSKFLDKPDLNAKESKRTVITGIVLTLLDENEILVRDPKEVGQRPAKDCLYKITFTDPDKQEGGSTIVLNSAFMISLEGVERLKTLEKVATCHSVPSFGNSIYGSKKIRGAEKPNVLETAALEELGIKDTGQEKSTVSVTSIAKAAPLDSMQQKVRITRALKQRNIVASEVKPGESTDLFIVGYNTFFQQIGIELIETDSEKNPYADVGIKSIKPSKKSPGDFVFCLSGEIYSRPPE
jgi:hypothetical protein